MMSEYENNVSWVKKKRWEERERWNKECPRVIRVKRGYKLCR